MEQFFFNNTEAPAIVNASEHHMALLFLLDTSGSMGAQLMGSNSTPINELNKAINRFKLEVCQDEHTKDILDVAVVEFNSEFRVVQEFSPIEYLKPVELQANGTTYLCEPLNVALDMVTERSRFYRRSGAEPYKPWIVIITDGMAMDDSRSLSATIERTAESVIIDILPNIEQMYISETNIELVSGETAPISATYPTGKYFNDTCKWKSSDAGVAVVDVLPNGNSSIRTLAPGECDIIYEAEEGGCSISCHVVVIDPEEAKRKEAKKFEKIDLLCMIGIPIAIIITVSILAVLLSIFK